MKGQLERRIQGDAAADRTQPDDDPMPIASPHQKCQESGGCEADRPSVEKTDNDHQIANAGDLMQVHPPREILVDARYRCAARHVLGKAAENPGGTQEDHNP